MTASQNAVTSTDASVVVSSSGVSEASSFSSSPPHAVAMRARASATAKSRIHLLLISIPSLDTTGPGQYGRHMLAPLELSSFATLRGNGEEKMIFKSPYPDVEIPQIGVAQFILQSAAGRGDKPALIDGPSGRTITFARAGRRDQAGRSGPGRPWILQGRRHGHLFAEHPGVRDRVPRHRAGRRHRHHREPAVHDRRAHLPAEGLGRSIHRDDPDVPRERSGGCRSAPVSKRSSSSARARERPPSPSC